MNPIFIILVLVAGIVTGSLAVAYWYEYKATQALKSEWDKQRDRLLEILRLASRRKP